MEKRFGYGEYERSDVETRLSTQYMRHTFLQTLIDRKSYWAKSLLRVVNYEMLPDKMRENLKEEQIFAFFLAYLFGSNPFITKGSEVYDDIPLNHFSKYLSKKNTILKRFEKKAEKEVKHWDQRDIRKRAMQLLIPDWPTLQTDPAAEALCKSILRWAADYNLADEWCLDFALMVLINFKTVLRFQKEDFKDLDTVLQKGNSYILWFDEGIREALRKSSSDFYFEKVMYPRWHIAMSNFDVPEFHFKYGEFEYSPKTWFPFSKFRSVFIKETTEGFNRWCKAIGNMGRYSNLNEDYYREQLRGYCDDVEQQVQVVTRDVPFMPYSVEPLFSACWVPSDMTRGDFIQMFIDNLKQGFDRGKKMATSLETLEKDRFDLNLFSYCNDIEKNLPEGYAKTPMKYKDSDRHFRWVVDNQVAPVKDYAEIAAADAESGETTTAAVKKAVQRLCSSIGKTRFMAPRTGRPRGIIEKGPRHRAEK